MSLLSVGSRRRRARLGAGCTVAIVAGALALPALAGAGTVSASSATGALSALVRVGVEPTIPEGARASGALPSSRSIQIGLSLKPRDPAALAAYASSVSTPGSAYFHRYLTPATFAARFGPTTAEVDEVEHAMRSAGLKVGALAANRLLLSMRGTVSDVEAAFHTSITRYELRGGQAGWATATAPRLAGVTADAVQSVLGLDDLVVPHSQLPQAQLTQAQLRRDPAKLDTPGAASKLDPGSGLPRAAASPAGAPTACDAADRAALLRGGGGWTDSQIAAAYGLEGLYARGDRGAGQTIALFELEPFSRSDVATFDRCYFGVSHLRQISTVRVDGFDLVGAGVGESILDIDDLSAFAPAARIIVYEAPNTTFGGIDEYNTIVSQDRANIVSSSWGECEQVLETGAPGDEQLENYIFEEAAAQGQTVVASAGDDGSDDCAGNPYGAPGAVQPYLSVDDPASQPYVLGAGGTSLLTVTNPPSESVWNDGNSGGAGGGGISSTWPMPAWQADSGVPGVAASGGREVPDVSASADPERGITVYSKSALDGWNLIGGTSSAAPTWAAVLAEIAASGGSCSTLPVTAGGTDLGFVAPELYAIASVPTTYAQSFTDITHGTNDMFGLGLGYTAHPGYNNASGLGTPVVTSAIGTGGLASTLCDEASTSSPTGSARPTVSGVAPAAGPTGGGTTVTITGSNFPTGATDEVHVSFGGASATVQSVTATTITVTAPPSDVANGTASVEAAGRVDVVVTLNTGSGATSSATGSSAVYEYVYQSTTSSTGATAPSVSGVGPEGGNVAGNITVTVYGTGFDAAGTPTVTIGGVAMTGVHVISDSELTAVVPPETSSTACATGVGFDPSTDCQTQVVVSDANGTSPTVPILPALSGPTVWNAQGAIAPTPETEVAPTATEYDYAPTPVITAITPDPANGSGTSPVTITGSGFNLNTFNWVNFGPATDTSSEQLQITSISPTKITIDPPAGPHDKRVVLPGGVSIQTDGGLSNVVRFGYAGIPSVRALSVLGGPSTGGTKIVVHGSGLSDVTSVQFASEITTINYGSSTSSIISHVTSNSVTVVAPAFVPGPVDVEPCTTSGCAASNTRTDTFVYFNPGKPSVEVLAPRSGPAMGGTEVVFAGNNLDSAIAVRFGNSLTTVLGKAVPAYYPDGDPYFLATLSTPGVAGSTVPVTVITRTGSARLLSGGTFHYVASAPAPPQDVKVSVEGTKANVTWKAPASDGGSPVTSYSVVALSGGAAPMGGTLAAGARSAVLDGIAANRQYIVRVAASNTAHGRGSWSNVGPFAVAYGSDGYRLAAASGSVTGRGSLPGLGGIAGSLDGSHVVAIAATTDGEGYWVATADGAVHAFGDAPGFQYARPASPVVGLAATPLAGGGYWEVTASGEVFAFGRAHNFGSISSKRKLSSPVTGISGTPDGRGYYIVTASGAVYTFGDAIYSGTAIGRPGGPIVAIAANLDGLGYWLLTASGTVYGFGTVTFGSPVLKTGQGTAVGLASSTDGHGYWVLTSRGDVYSFGDATYEGGAAPVAGGYVGIATT